MPAEIRAELEEHARSEAPNEACGLVAFRDDRAERYLPVLGPYRQAVALYQSHEFEAARRLFLIALNASAEGIDRPSRLYVERCVEYVQSPPGPDWDGVYRMRLKAVA